MVDGNIDPKSVEAMENFKKYSKEAEQNMKALQTQMDKFTDIIIVGSCILTIIAGSIFGALMLIQTL